MGLQKHARTYVHNFSDCSTNTTLDAPESPTEGSFSSPYYPDGFPMNITCGWYITAPENHTIKVEITSGLSSLSSSSVEVYDVDGSELSAINRHFKYFENTVYSKFRKVYVLFKSGDQRRPMERGISVSYTAIKIGKPDHISSSCDCLMNVL